MADNKKALTNEEIRADAAEAGAEVRAAAETAEAENLAAETNAAAEAAETNYAAAPAAKPEQTKHGARTARIIIAAAVVIIAAAAAVVAEPWVKPVIAETPEAYIERAQQVEAAEGETLTLEIPLTEDEAIKFVDGAELKDGRVIFTAAEAGEKTVTVTTEEKEAPAAPELDFIGKARAYIRKRIGIAPDEYRTEKAELRLYMIPVTVTVKEPEQVQGEAIALDFEESRSRILVYGEPPVVSMADEAIAKAAVVGYSVVVKPVSEAGGETTLTVTADGKETIYPVTVTAKPEDKPSGGSTGGGTSTRPSGGGSTGGNTGGNTGGSTGGNTGGSTVDPNAGGLTVAEVRSIVKSFVAQYGGTWDPSLTKDNASWGVDSWVKYDAANRDTYIARLREDVSRLIVTYGMTYINALVYDYDGGIEVEYLY